LGEDLAAPGVEHGENLGLSCAQQGRGSQGGQRRVLRERGAGHKRQTTGGGQGDTYTGKGAGTNPDQDALHFIHVRPGKVESGMDRREQRLRGATGRYRGLGEHLPPALSRAGNAGRDDPGRRVEG
jgi:hypothetical protein